MAAEGLPAAEAVSCFGVVGLEEAAVLVPTPVALLVALLVARRKELSPLRKLNCNLGELSNLGGAASSFSRAGDPTSAWCLTST